MFSKIRFYFSLIKKKAASILPFLKMKLLDFILPELNMGKDCKFTGTPKFHIKPFSKIVIGNNCEFLSRFSSNLIGLNHPIIISTITKNAELVIGNNCGFSGTVIGTFEKIEIGNNVRCGANTIITDSDWHLDDPRAGPTKAVKIGNNVWLGVNSIVLKGVTIGENSVIGANSVVVKDIPANVVAAGNPCKVLKEIDENIPQI